MKGKLNLYLQIQIRIVCCLLILGFSSGIVAQDNVSLRMDFSPDSVRLGQPFNLQLQLSIPEGAKINNIQFFPDSIIVLARAFKDSSAVPYEFQDYGSWAAASEYRFLPAQLGWKANSNGTVQLFQNNFKLYVWEPGVFVFPAVKAEIQLSTGTYEVFSNTEQFRIGVADQSMVAGIDSMGLAPLKSIIREKNKSYWNWIIGVVLGLLVMFLGIYYSKKNKWTQPIPPPKPISADEKAMKALAEIEHKKDWEKGFLKKYYDELTLVIRRYFEDRYEVKALESTSDEFLRDLKSVAIDDAWKQELKRLLPMADLVKFAKANPEHEEHTRWLNWAKELIAATKEKVVETENDHDQNFPQKKS